MKLSSGKQRCNLLTAKDKLRKAKNNFLRVRKTGNDAFVHLAKKHKRAVRRDIGSIGGEFIHELKGRKDHA